MLKYQMNSINKQRHLTISLRFEFSLYCPRKSNGRLTVKESLTLRTFYLYQIHVVNAKKCVQKCVRSISQLNLSEWETNRFM